MNRAESRNTFVYRLYVIDDQNPVVFVQGGPKIAWQVCIIASTDHHLAGCPGIQQMDRKLQTLLTQIYLSVCYFIRAYYGYMQCSIYSSWFAGLVTSFSEAF